MRLIDADKVEETLKELEKGENECWTPLEFKDYVLDYQETVDAEPVVHSSWVFAGNDGNVCRYFCLHCGLQIAVPKENGTALWRRCPNCGANMDEQAEN